MIEIIPSLLVESRDEFERRLRLVEHDCEMVHVDILDGSLFGNTNWFDAKQVGALRTPVVFELHLMVENPLPIIAAWKKSVKGTRRAIVHAEIKRPVGAVIDAIHEVYHLEAGLALDPETELSTKEHLIHEIEQLTLMGVRPGHSGATFRGESILNKIRQARAHLPNLPIEIDGGVTRELVGPLVKAGVTHLCTASLLFQADNPTLALRNMKETLSTAMQKM